MAHIYGLYDTKEYEQCVYFGTINEIAKYLEYNPSSLRSYLTKRKNSKYKLLKHRYYLAKMNDEYIEEEPKLTDKYKVCKQVLDAFRPEKVKFPLFDEREYYLKGILNQQIYNEKWKQIEGTHYSISNYGRVKNNETNKFKSPRFKLFSYQVDIYVNGKRHTCQVARLVANYFIRKIKDNERVRHTDGDARNNYYKNLRIVSK